VYCIQVVPPIATRRWPCHSMSDSAVGIANRFRKLFGFGQIEAHPAVENHHYPHHAKLVPIESACPSIPSQTMGRRTSFPSIPSRMMERCTSYPSVPSWMTGGAHHPCHHALGGWGAQPVHHHSHHRHHRLQDAPFTGRLSHGLVMSGCWEGKAIALVLGKWARSRRVLCD